MCHAIQRHHRLDGTFVVVVAACAAVEQSGITPGLFSLFQDQL